MQIDKVDGQWVQASEPQGTTTFTPEQYDQIDVLLTGVGFHRAPSLLLRYEGHFMFLGNPFGMEEGDKYQDVPVMFIFSMFYGDASFCFKFQELGGFAQRLIRIHTVEELSEELSHWAFNNTIIPYNGWIDAKKERERKILETKRSLQYQRGMMQLLGNRVLVDPDKLTKETGSGIVLLNQSMQDVNTKRRGTVYATGNEVKFAGVSDRVLFHRETGMEIQIEGITYLMLNEDQLDIITNEDQTERD